MLEKSWEDYVGSKIAEIFRRKWKDRSRKERFSTVQTLSKKRSERERERKFLLSSLRHCSRQYSVCWGWRDPSPCLSLRFIGSESSVLGKWCAKRKVGGKERGGNIVERRTSENLQRREEEMWITCSLLNRQRLSQASTSELLNNWFTSSSFFSLSLSLLPSCEF